MKTIAWTSMLLGLALFAAGCPKSEPEPPAKPAPGAQLPDPPPPEQPAGPQAKEQPVKDAESVKIEDTMAGAIGRALLKGIAGGSEPKEDERGEAPPF